MTTARLPEGPSPQALSLDHVGLIVQDLHAAQMLMADLGFDLTARADHTLTTADGRTVSAGSSQHAIMLAHGYIELMHISGPQAAHHLVQAPQERFGLHILALATRDAEESHAHFGAVGQAVGPIRRWAREVDEPDRKGLARFVYFDAPWVPQDPSYLCWVQHLTPELMRSTQAPHHPNTALSVRAIHYVGPATDTVAWVLRLQHLGMAAHVTADRTVLALGPFQIQVQTQADLPGVVPTVLEIGFQSLDDIRARCHRAGLPCQDVQGGRLQIHLRAPLGIELQCVVQDTGR